MKLLDHQVKKTVGNCGVCCGQWAQHMVMPIIFLFLLACLSALHKKLPADQMRLLLHRHLLPNQLQIWAAAYATTTTLASSTALAGHQVPAPPPSQQQQRHGGRRSGAMPCASSGQQQAAELHLNQQQQQQQQQVAAFICRGSVQQRSTQAPTMQQPAACQSSSSRSRSIRDLWPRPPLFSSSSSSSSPGWVSRLTRHLAGSTCIHTTQHAGFSSSSSSSSSAPDPVQGFVRGGFTPDMFPPERIR